MLSKISTTASQQEIQDNEEKKQVLYDKKS